MGEKKDKKIKLVFGKTLIVEPGSELYDFRDMITEGAVYFIIAGMIRMECHLSVDNTLKYYLQPGSVFGLEETPETKTRIARAVAVEKTMLFKWTRNHFYQAADESRALAIVTIKSLARMIRILNAEYSEYLKKLQKTGTLADETKGEQELDMRLGSVYKMEAPSQLRHTFYDKQVLIREGDIQKQVLLILNGEVYVTKNVNNHQQILATLGKGELIGEMSFFDKSLTSATVVANGDVQALVFSRLDFKEIFFKNRKWVKQLLLSLSRRIMVMVRKFQKFNSSEPAAVSRKGQN